MSEWQALQLCKHCGGGESGKEDMEMLLCDCCVAVGAHIACHNRAVSGAQISLEDAARPSFQWFCGKVRY